MIDSTSPPSGPFEDPAQDPIDDRKVWQRWPKKVWVGLAIVGTYVLIAVFAPLLAPYDPLAIEPVNKLASPSAGHWLGTDELGRDVLSRLIYAARVDLLIGFLGALLPMVLGTILGALAGFFGGWVDTIVMRTADVFQAFPAYILIIVLVFAMGQGARSILVAFTVLAWVIYARIIRGEILRVRDLDYVHAARVAGLSKLRILAVHVLPNSINQTLVYLPSDIVFATLALAAFSFLGLGIPPPTPEWGAMIAEGQPFIRSNWWLATVPGLVIVVLGLGISLIGEGLEERLHG
jgi:peptide/nickel transport system permease protein